MQVKLLTSRAYCHPQHGMCAQSAGTVIDVDGDEAARLVGNGQAEALEAQQAPPPRPERPPAPREATAPPKRDAAKRR